MAGAIALCNPVKNVDRKKKEGKLNGRRKKTFTGISRKQETFFFIYCVVVFIHLSIH